MKAGWKTRIDERRYFEEKKAAKQIAAAQRKFAEQEAQIRRKFFDATLTRQRGSFP